MFISNYHRRIKAVFLCIILFFFVCFIRLLYIQFFRSAHLADIASKQHNLLVELEPRRGTIFDVNLKPFAINLAVDSLFAEPHIMRQADIERAVKNLAQILKVDSSFIRERLTRNKAFVWVARKVDPQASETIKKLQLKGIGFIRETKRSYHNAYLGSHFIGFAGLDNVGLDGLEMRYDSYLRGEPGWSLFLRDARQKKLDFQEKMLLPKDGYDLVLTIDEVIQYIAERELDKVFRQYHAQGASIVVMDPHTGAILALANRPTYDPNASGKAGLDARRDRALSDLFEPGSVFKIVAASAALEEGKVTESDQFFCENGAWKYSTQILHDHKSHGTLTFREVIEQSSNIGTAKVALLLGPNTIYKYMRLFGFGRKSDIDLPGEINGMVSDPSRWSKISITRIPIGQGIGTTTLQLVNAISVIANGGQLMKPYIVKEIRDKYGVLIKKFEPQMKQKVIKLETAARMKKILTGVIENGTGKLAKVPGFSAGGKTGTAQKLEPNGTYSHRLYTASFIGFAPSEDPVIAIAVIVDEPHPYYFGGVVSAPVFKNVAYDVLRYLNVKQMSREGSLPNETQSDSGNAGSISD